MKEKLNRLPKAAGIAILVVCILSGVTLGNGNALRDAEREANRSLPAVQEILSERGGKASNLITLCERYLPDSDATAQLRAARDAVSAAQSAEEMYDANLHLSGTAEAAYIALDQSDISETDRRLLTGAMDELRSSQLQLERQARSYNEEMDDVLDVYRKLPTRFLHEEPKGFE